MTEMISTATAVNGTICGTTNLTTGASSSITCYNYPIPIQSNTIIDTCVVGTTCYSNRKEQEAKMDRACGYGMNCTIPNYAWDGANFALHCIGLAVVILACCFAYNIWKSANK
jgi:hypothetical protein